MVESQSSNGYSNAVLARLSTQAQQRVHSPASAGHSEVRQNISRPNELVCHAYFVETGMISIVSIMKTAAASKSAPSAREEPAGRLAPA
jgi:hypothetical protein